MFRYMHEEVNDIRPARNYNDPAPNPGATVYTPALNALIRWTYDITPSIINTAGLAYTYQKVNLFPTGMFTVPSGLFTQAFNNGDDRLPGVTIGSFWSWLGVGVQPNFSKTGDGIFSDDFSWVHGRHVVQVGGLYMWNILRVNASAFSQGNFSFGSGTHTGDTAADFLLGTLTSYSQSNVQRSGAFHQHWFELYGQDDFKATPRLTLSAGLRYSFYSPTTMEGNDISNFNAATFVASQAPAITQGSGGFIVNSSNQPLTPVWHSRQLPHQRHRIRLPERHALRLHQPAQTPLRAAPRLRLPPQQRRHHVDARWLWHRLRAGRHVPDLFAAQQHALRLHAHLQQHSVQLPRGRRCSTSRPAIPLRSGQHLPSRHGAVLVAHRRG